MINSFENFKLSKHLRYALDDLGFKKPTPIQEAVFSVILSGRDMVGIAQTGTGKTLAYMLPILQDFKFSKQTNPRILILVPTRELVIQVVEHIESYTKYMNVRILGVYGGTNINIQRQAVAQGTDILVATPGRLYDLALSRSLKLNAVKKLVIDEVDVMLDLGFRFQLINIFELLPERRQNTMFSATMTKEVDALIDDFFIAPQKIAIAVSGTPLSNIEQQSYPVPNFYTKINLLAHLLKDKNEYRKVLVFVSTKKQADIVFETLEERLYSGIGIIHSNKSQNYRIRAVEEFDEGKNRILISTDVMARGIDLDRITHVISFDTPDYPENYIHRIGRTGRAEKRGKSILFYTPKEKQSKTALENLMEAEIQELDFPAEVGLSTQLIPEERPIIIEKYSRNQNKIKRVDRFEEKSEKNKKVNLGGTYHRELAKKYKKPKTRGDKKFNNRKKK